ncbi:hypothetical protein D030_3121A, partial [Vibrio parahaemolyticus AQ3810]
MRGRRFRSARKSRIA